MKLKGYEVITPEYLATLKNLDKKAPKVNFF